MRVKFVLFNNPTIDNNVNNQSFEQTLLNQKKNAERSLSTNISESHTGGSGNSSKNISPKGGISISTHGDEDHHDCKQG